MPETLAETATLALLAPLARYASDESGLEECTAVRYLIIRPRMSFFLLQWSEILCGTGSGGRLEWRWRKWGGAVRVLALAPVKVVVVMMMMMMGMRAVDRLVLYNRAIVPSA